MTNTQTKSELAQWYEHATGHHLNPSQQRLIKTLVSLDRIYNLVNYLAGNTVADKFHWNARGLTIYYRGSIATYDDDKLTRLLKAAHNNAVRIEISARSNSTFAIYATPRSHTGQRFYDRHPTWTEAGYEVEQ